MPPVSVSSPDAQKAKQPVAKASCSAMCPQSKCWKCTPSDVSTGTLTKTAVKTCGYMHCVGRHKPGKRVTCSSEVSGSSNKAPVCVSIAQLTAAASTINMSVTDSRFHISSPPTDSWQYRHVIRTTTACQKAGVKHSRNANHSIAHQTCCATALQHRPRLRKWH